jgi:hypothetical protein
LESSEKTLEDARSFIEKIHKKRLKLQTSDESDVNTMREEEDEETRMRRRSSENAVNRETAMEIYNKLRSDRGEPVPRSIITDDPLFEIQAAAATGSGEQIGLKRKPSNVQPFSNVNVSGKITMPTESNSTAAPMNESSQKRFLSRFLPTRNNNNNPMNNLSLLSLSAKDQKTSKKSLLKNIFKR